MTLVYAIQARPADRLWGDESTYLAMATSLARDGDMKYTEADRSWVLERRPGALILQQGEGEGDALGYSKPIVYPLLAAPFVRVFGERGMLLANVAILLFAFVLTWDYLLRFGDRVGARAVGLTFLVASPIIPYLFWRMSESAQVGLSLAGLVLCCRDLRFHPREGAADGEAPIDLRRIAAGGVLLGLLIALRLPNVVVAAAPLSAWVAYRRPKPFWTLLLAIGLTFAACTGLTQALTGSPNPYRAVRTSFDQVTGYPTPAEASEQLSPKPTSPLPGETETITDGKPDRFESAPATHRAYWRLLPEWRRTAYATVFAFIGRHTGLLFYFPALWILLPSYRRPDRLTFCLLTGAVGLFAFYLLWLPGNYFGGSTFIGNRYWLAAYPLLLVALPRLPSTRAVGLGWLVTGAIGFSALLGVLEADREGRVDSQSHARQGIFRWLPAESPVNAIDGWVSRQWSGTVLRFLDPHVEIAEQGFILPAHEQKAETQIALLVRAPLRFATQADTAGELEISDWRHTESFQLEPGVAQVIRFTPAPSWRRHPTTPGPTKEVFGVDFRFKAPSGRVELRYLGTGDERQTAHRLRRATLPESGFAGSTLDAWVAVQNHSNWVWSSDGVLPLYLTYRFEPLGSGEVVPRVRIPLPNRVEPRGTLRIPFEIVWPSTPGRYELTIDLEQELLGPFANRLGEPIVQKQIAVGAND